MPAFLVERLQFDQFGIDAALCEQFGVGALLGHAAVVDDDDLVGVVDRRQAVGDNHRRAADEQLVEGILHEFFALRIECRGGLVEDQYLGVLQYGACDRKPLALASREFDAPVADVGLVAFGGFLYEAVGIGDPGSLDDLFVRGPGPCPWRCCLRWCR